MIGYQLFSMQFINHLFLSHLQSHLIIDGEPWWPILDAYQPLLMLINVHYERYWEARLFLNHYSLLSTIIHHLVHQRLFNHYWPFYSLLSTIPINHYSWWSGDYWCSCYSPSFFLVPPPPVGHAIAPSFDINPRVAGRWTSSGTGAMLRVFGCNQPMIYQESEDMVS